MISYIPAKFGGHRHFCNGNVMVLVCHLFLQDHMTKGSSNMGRIPSRLVTITPSLVAIGTVVVKIYWF